MIWPVISFELKQCFRMWSGYIYFILFFSITFIVFLGLGGAFGDSAGHHSQSLKVLVNSPYTLYHYCTLISLMGLILVAGLMGKSLCRDVQLNIYPLFFTKPITKLDYFLGKFVSSFLQLLFIFGSIGLGAFAASWMPLVDRTLFGPTSIWSYLWPYVVSIGPTIFLTGGLFFSLAALTRKMFPIYAGSVVLFVGYALGTEWVENLDNLYWAAVLDPFGYATELAITRYWTIAEKNSQLLPPTGLILINRLIWCSVSVIALIAAYLNFSFSRYHVSHKGNSAPKDLSEPPVAVHELPQVESNFSWKFSGVVLWKLMKLELKTIVRNTSFIIILLCAVLLVLATGFETGEHMGTKIYPVTYAVIEGVTPWFGLFSIILIVFFSGEVVWRDREVRMDQIIASIPAPNWIFYLSKLGALIAVQYLFVSIILICCLFIQMMFGYFNFQLSLYFFSFYGLEMAKILPIWIFALFVQTVFQRKLLAYGLTIVFFITFGKLDLIGLHHELFKFFHPPKVLYSAMNGFGHFLEPYFWIASYWNSLAFCLVVVSVMFWVRYQETHLGTRFRTALKNMQSTPKRFLLGGISGCLCLGAVILYNTTVLNEYRPIPTRIRELVDYELTFNRFKEINQPRISAVNVEVDLYPDTRTVQGRGHYRLDNRSLAPIQQIFVNFPGHFTDPKGLTLGTVNRVTVKELSLNRPYSQQENDPRLGVHILRLAQSLPIGESVCLHFEVILEHRGFASGISTTRILQNGTFLDYRLLFPTIGYDSELELAQERLRKKFRLAPKPRTSALTDLAALQNNGLSRDADLITFEAVVSTIPDQIALAPGYLQEEWIDKNRRYFRYSSQGPVLNFYSFLSAEYSQQRTQWNDIDIEFYYHEGHEYNLESMAQAVKDSLSYFTQQFGPYQYHQVRIVEFPRYNRFAQAFPNTIPFSEAAGFIARVDPNDVLGIDYPYYITSHEVAHQWWGHQVCPAAVEGEEMVTEVLACYSSLMVLKMKRGEHHMGRVLRFELDNYLSGRSAEQIEEVPLYKVTSEQPYLFYSKGALVMYALQDYCGAEVVNRALANFVRNKAFGGPPYPTSLDLLDYLKAEIQEEKQWLLTDFFERIILYDLQTDEATVTSTENGKYSVKLRLQAHKIEADGLGNERVIPLHQTIDVGIFDEQDHVLYLQKHLITDQVTELVIQVDQQPTRAGIDPYHKLIDRKPEDNTLSI